MSTSTAETQTQNFRLWLQKQFTDRSRVNSRYSLRAFSRLLQMEASSVSQIMSGKRNPSKKVVDHICDRLSVGPETRESFTVTSKMSRKQVETAPLNFQQLAQDAFAIIADWYHYGILELTFVEDFESEPEWIAKRLGISSVEASIAIERLLRLELLARVDGRLLKTERFITNYSEGLTGPALKELQRQLLKKALEAIDMTPLEQKDITSMTMAIDPKKIPEAKARIKKFRRQLCEFLEDGERTVVYNLGVQLFPLSTATQSQGDEET